MSGNNYNINPFYLAFGIATSDAGIRHLMENGNIPDANGVGLGLGMNLAWINSWAGAYVFSNLMYNATIPVRVTGTTPFTLKQGLITTTSTTDKFRFMMADQYKYLQGNQGVYTILNPSRQRICIANWNTPDDSQFTTDAVFTYTIDSTGQGRAFCLWVQGSLTNTDGNVAVILPGHLESWQSGNIWNSQFLEFYNDINPPLVRAMDWNNASGNIETDWADRALPGYPTLTTPHSDVSSVPYEFYCDLATRIRAEVWACIPHRATDAYIDEFSKLFAAQYPTNKKLWVEYCNEVWNFAYPWNLGSQWIERINHTRYTATVDVASSVCTLIGHGLTTGDGLISHPLAYDRQNGVKPFWQLYTGATVYAKVLTANTFEVYTGADLLTRIDMVTGQINILYTRVVEPGKVVDMDANYSARLLQIWDLMEVNMAPSRLTRIVASQASNVYHTTRRIETPNILERGDVLAIAPYFDGVWWGVKADASSGQIIPSVWSVRSDTIHIAVYPQLPDGETVSNIDIINGTGAISKQSYSYVAGGNTYNAAPAFTGLTDGVAYDVFFLFLEDPLTRVLSLRITPNTVASTVYKEADYVDQALSQEISAENNTNGYNTHLDSIAAAGGAGKMSVVAYEGGVHYHQSAPASVTAWVDLYLESAEFAGTMKRYLMRMASKGMKYYCHYADSLGTRFRIANGFHDVTDKRYKVFKNFNGLAPQLPASIVDIPEYTPLKEAPASFPHIVFTFPEEVGAVYTLIKGNDGNNFRIDGFNFVMDNDVGVDWAHPKVRDMTIHKRSEFLSATGVLQLALGDAWYEVDAKFAWSPIGTTSTTSMVPDIGTTLPLIAGTGATISGDLWKFNLDAVYKSAAALTNLNLSSGLFMGMVLDVDSGGGWYKLITRLGGGDFMSYYFSEPTKLILYSYLGGGCPEVNWSANGLPTGKHVFWFFYDPILTTFYVGIDQTVITLAVDDRSSRAVSSHLWVGGGDNTPTSKSKHGSIQIVNRDGLTLDAAKVISATMAAHHGIV